jgi:hypothetical protein
MLMLHNYSITTQDCYNSTMFFILSFQANSLQIDASHRTIHLYSTKDLDKKIIFNVDADLSAFLFCGSS